MEQMELTFDCNPNCICVSCAENQFTCERSDCPWCAGDGLEPVKLQTAMMGEVTVLCKHYKEEIAHKLKREKS